MAYDPLSWIDEELARLEARHLRRRLATRPGPQLPAHLPGESGPLVNFSTNDYLGYAADPRLATAAAEALAHQGFGAGASPLVSGRSLEHEALESELAHFEQSEAALLFTSGYAANVGAVTALAGKGDLILSDAKNHASLIDGCRLSGATVRIYAHNQLADLRRALTGSERFRRRLLVTDSLFSMDGDLAPLPDLAELAERHRAMLLVDEAHATGVLGEWGRGACEHFGVHQGVHVRVGTLSKALGGTGGFVAGSRPLVEFLANRARPYVYSTAAPAACCAAARAALRCVREEPQRRSELLARAAELRRQLGAQGWRIPPGISQIVPLVVGEPQRAVELSARLRAAGYLVPAIRPPSVPEGESLLRLSLSYAHSPAALQGLCQALAELAAEAAGAAPAPAARNTALSVAQSAAAKGGPA